MLQEQLLRELCIEELENVYSGVLKRRSVLLQLKKDILFNHSAQINPIMPRPLLAAPLLFCTAVDLVIRIKYKKTRPGSNSKYFMESAVDFFELSQDDAKNLWNLRNSLSHQYSSFNFLIISADGGNIISSGSRGSIVINTTPMLRLMELACSNLYNFLLAESGVDQNKTREFINKHCHVYYRF